MKRSAPVSASSTDSDDLGCPPNVVTRICFRLLDILANLTDTTGSRPLSSATGRKFHDTNTTNVIEQIETLVQDLQKIQENPTVASGTGSPDPSGFIPLMSDGTVASEKKRVEKLWKDWSEYQQRMDDCARKMAEWRRRLPVTETPFVPAEQHFRFDSSRPLSGIMHYLLGVSGDVATMLQSEVVTLSASSRFKDLDPSVVVDQNPSTCFHTESKPFSWLCLDFHDMRVRPTSYTLQTRSDADAGSSHPKSWVLEGSQTGTDWFKLDAQTDADMNRKAAHKTSEIFEPLSAEYRYIRIRLTGPTYRGDHYLSVCSFELFGILLSPTGFPGSSPT
jgi:hypothetical protein